MESLFRTLPVILVVVVVNAALLMPRSTTACTNLVVTPKASANGHTLLAYTADGTHTYGGLYHWNAQTNIPNGTTRKVYDWDFGTYLGEVRFFVFAWLFLFSSVVCVCVCVCVCFVLFLLLPSYVFFLVILF